MSYYNQLQLTGSGGSVAYARLNPIYEQQAPQFPTPNPYQLAVTIPNGGGTVTSSPAGILTASGIFVSTFAANASVTLTTAAAAGYRFGGWANAGCHGLTPCIVVSLLKCRIGTEHRPRTAFSDDASMSSHHCRRCVGAR